MKGIKKDDKVCKNCKHWKSEQSELEYSEFYGICTSSKHKFTVDGEQGATVLDRVDRSDKHMGVSRFESLSDVIPYGTPVKSRYCFVSQDTFGCINFSK